MKFEPDDKFWIVLDPTPYSEIGDILFEASLRDLELQFKGGLQMDRNPTLFTERKEAKDEAFGRLTMMRAFRLIFQSKDKALLKAGFRLVIFGEGNRVLFEEDLRGVADDNE
jgi:glycogen synthase